MKDIAKIHNLVEYTLINKPETRNSDMLLYVSVCKMVNPSVMEQKFEEVLLRRKELGIPNFETIRRTRQKIQHNNELLRAVKEVTDERYENWKVVREYAME